MRKKSGFTIVEQAIILVFAFEDVVSKMEQQGVFKSLSQQETGTGVYVDPLIHWHHAKGFAR